MATYTPKINTNKWFPDKSDLAKYLQNTPIPTEEAIEQAVDKYLQEKPITGNFYSPDNPPPYPVTSVNGKTGAVTGLYDANNQPPYPVTSVNGKTGAVTIDIDTSGLYSPTNPPPYPVTSVNGKTGAVTIPSFAVGAAKLITPTNINTDNVTLTLSGYTQGKYKMIFVLFDCYSTNKDTGIALRANTAKVTLYSGVSDYDGGQYNYKVDGVICYPTALDDGGVLSLVASDGGAQIYTAQEANYWWGVE